MPRGSRENRPPVPGAEKSRPELSPRLVKNHQDKGEKALSGKAEEPVKAEIEGLSDEEWEQRLKAERDAFLATRKKNNQTFESLFRKKE